MLEDAMTQRYTSPLGRQPCCCFELSSTRRCCARGKAVPKWESVVAVPDEQAIRQVLMLNPSQQPHAAGLCHFTCKFLARIQASLTTSICAFAELS